MYRTRNIICLIIILSVALFSCDFLYGPAAEGQDDNDATVTAPTTPTTPTSTSPDQVSGLVYWFSADSGVTADGSNNVSAWANRAGNGLNATQITATNQPLLVNGSLNGLPVVRFTRPTAGSGDSLQYDGTQYVGASNTIFFVVRISSPEPNNYMIGGEVNSKNVNLYVGFDPDTVLHYGHWDNDLLVTVAAPTAGALITCALNANTARYCYYNGQLAGATSDATSIAPLSAYTNASIGGLYITGGGSSGIFFNGDIAEYIGYNRLLTDEERQAVETYLNNKYVLY